MGKQIKVEVIIGAKRIPKTYEEGVTYEQVAKEVQSAYSYPIILARRGGKLVELNKRIREDVQICFMTTADDSGHKTYVRGVTLLMLRAFYAVCKGQPLENVYVKYEGVDRISIVPVQDGKIAIKAPQIQNIKSRAVINTKNSNEYGLLSINGTLMFEDMYPQLGDYDFNDFVARYNLRILYKYSRGKYYAHKMCISVQIRAVGGIYKYEPYIRLTKVKADNIIIETTEKNVKSIKGPNGEAIISYKSPTPPSGYKYYNTEKNEMTKPDKFKEIWITLKNPIEYEDVMDKNYNIDMYIAKENHKQEIHLKGYEPVYDQHQDYADKNNFVWGIRTWGIFDHAIEGKNFLKAYPQFKGWVTSGGKEYKRWWEEVDYRYVIRN